MVEFILVVVLGEPNFVLVVAFTDLGMQFSLGLVVTPLDWHLFVYLTHAYISYDKISVLGMCE